MCLTYVDDNEHAREASGVGWKVFVERWGRLYSWLHGHDGPYDIAVWYEAFGFAPDEMQPYWRGFHVFETRKGASAWLGFHQSEVIRKVRWRHRLAMGRQYADNQYHACIVAQEILILPAKSKRCAA